MRGCHLVVQVSHFMKTWNQAILRVRSAQLDVVVALIVYASYIEKQTGLRVLVWVKLPTKKLFDPGCHWLGVVVSGATQEARNPGGYRVGKDTGWGLWHLCLGSCVCSPRCIHVLGHLLHARTAESCPSRSVDPSGRLCNLRMPFQGSLIWCIFHYQNHNFHRLPTNSM